MSDSEGVALVVPGQQPNTVQVSREAAEPLLEAQARAGAVGELLLQTCGHGLCLNAAVFKAHYPQVNLAPAGTAPDRERLLAALEAGYYRADLWSYVVLLFGEIGQISNADPDEIFATLPVISRRVTQLFAPADAAPILESLDGIRAGCKAPKKRKTDRDAVEDYATRVQSRLRRCSSPSA